MLNFACVFYGDKYIRPPTDPWSYVRNLYNMVERNLTIPYRFICLQTVQSYTNKKSLEVKT
jgi:hypothetical protein